MEEKTCKSEVARLRQQITLEYEAAERGLHGLSQGTTQHAFITKRMENMAACHQALKTLVGEQEAVKILAETLQAAGQQEH